MKRHILITAITLLLAVALPARALAQQTYFFSLDKERVDVYWNADGGETLAYAFDFTDQPGAHPIDFVDVGTPNSNFDMSTVTADVNGNSVEVSKSDYQGSGSGFSVVMGQYAIQPGSSGSVHVSIGSITGVLYADTGDNTYASADFAPTYFGSQYVTGSTDLTVTFHMPPGVKPGEPRWHASPTSFPDQPQTGIDNQGRITYTWQSPSASAASQYTFGASFPKSYVPADAIITPPAIDFTAIINAVVSSLGAIFCIGFFAFLFIGLPVLSVIQGQRRKLQYIPPKIGIEGHGIKRGLTAVEAATLMEEPLDKVMTMILFGVIKKNAARVISREPLQLEVVSSLPADLHDYESSFLVAFRESDIIRRRNLLSDMTVNLVKSVSEKMKGFSRKETQDYYKNIMEQAWNQVETAQTPEIKSQAFDQNLEWTMLDHDYDNRSRRVFTGPIFVPMWWGGYDPTWHQSAAAAPGTPPTSLSGNRPSMSSQSLPGASMAASVVGGVQTFSSKVIGDLNAFTSKVTNVTNPPPPPTTSSYRGGGGGGCACACACAGCACACAGGGR
jgi:hypothetical protein